MRTRVEGYDKKSILVTTNKTHKIINCNNATVRIWLSQGTVVDVKRNDMLYPNIWKIQTINGPVGKFIYRQCSDRADLWKSDRFETEEEFVRYIIIPAKKYKGDDV